MKYLSITMISFLLFASTVHARPFATDEFGTTPGDSFDLELGLDYDGEEVSSGVALLHGITPRMDIGFEIPLSPERGELSIAAKLNLIQKGDHGLAVSFALSPGTEDFDLNAILGTEVGPLCVSGNVGAMGAFSALGLGLLAYTELSEFVSVGAEIVADHNDEDTKIWGGVGVTYSIGESLTLDAGFLAPLKGDGGYSATIGAVIGM